MSSGCPSTIKMVLRGAISVSLLICFTSASPARQFGEPVPGQTENLPKNPLEQIPEAPLQSKEVIPDPAKSDASQKVPSSQHIQTDTESDLNRLPVAQSEANDLNVNGNEAGADVPPDLSTDQGFSNEFVKKLLRGFFDELKKRPDLVEQILRYETLKELTRARPDTMFLPSDVMMANLQELNPQPLEKAPKLDTLTQGGTQIQTQAPSQQAAAGASSTNTQIEQTLSQSPDVQNEAASKRDSTVAGNSTVAGSQDQMADGKAQIETPKSKGDNHMPTAPLQDPFYYYFYYPDDEMPTETDTFLDGPTLNNMNNGGTPSPEDAVIDKLAKSVLAVIQYGLESNNDNSNINNNNNNNNNNNDIKSISAGSSNSDNIKDITHKNNMSMDKLGDSAPTPSFDQDENQDIKAGIKNSEKAANADTLNREEDELSKLARTSGD